MIYAVGDVHGEIGRLRQLWVKMLDAGLSIEDDLIFLGDVIDRGPCSKETIDFLLELQTQYPRMCLLRGNHEQMMLDARNDVIPVRRVGSGLQVTCGPLFLFWWNNGGNRAFASYAGSGDVCDWVRLIPDEHWRLIESTPEERVVGGYHFAHAGLVPPGEIWTDAHPQMRNAKLWIWKQFLDSDADFDGKVVVFGHSIQRGGKPLIHHNKIGIDTGCGAGGPLTCAILDPSARGTDRIISARFLQA